MTLRGANADQITTAAMIWSQDEALLFELLEGDCYVFYPQRRTVTPDGDDLSVAERVKSLDRILETLPKISPGLPMNLRDVGPAKSAAGKQMDVCRHTEAFA